uniref:Uncharacterized protein n=1 Tax=Oryza brachyantha TaxID=4533 RepID=J3L7Z3_ORYBR
MPACIYHLLAVQPLHSSIQAVGHIIYSSLLTYHWKHNTTLAHQKDEHRRVEQPVSHRPEEAVQQHQDGQGRHGNVD